MKDKPLISSADLASAFAAGFGIGRRGHEHQTRSCSFPATKHDLEQLEESLAMKLSELKGSIDQIKSQVSKVAAEQQARFDALSAKVSELESQLADAEIPQEATDALAEVKTALQALDDTIPDPLPETPAS